MEIEEAYKLLKEYNKWRRGKGKKYAQPGMPLDTTKIGLAIDVAINHLSWLFSGNDLIRLVSLVSKEHKKDDVYRKAVKICKKIKRQNERLAKKE
jgi:hypothetical protein